MILLITLGLSCYKSSNTQMFTVMFMYCSVLADLLCHNVRKKIENVFSCNETKRFMIKKKTFSLKVGIFK